MINKSKIKIGVIGLGYVGTPLALSFGKYFDVVGYDNDKRRIIYLKNKKDLTKETNVKDFILAKKIIFTNNAENLKDCTIFIVTVPATIITSDCLGVALGIAPNRVKSCLGPAAAIISIAQQASPN